MNKKIFSFIIIAIMIMAFSNSSFASAINSTNIKDSDVTKSYSRVLTYDEAIKVLIEKKGISRKQAEDKLNSVTALKDVVLQSLVYMELVTVQDFGNNQGVEYGVLALVDTYGSGRFFDSIVDKWEGPSGSGFHTYTNYYHRPELASGSCPIKLYDYARGQLTVEVTYSSSQAANVGISEFVDAGFSVENTVGLTYYFRKTQSFSHVYSLY